MRFLFQTSAGMFIWYQILPITPPSVLLIETSSDRLQTHGVGESRGIPHLAIKQTAGPQPFGFATCFTATPRDIVVCNSRGLLVSLSWQGTVNIHGGTSVAAMPFAASSSEHFTSITYDAICDVFAAVSSKGNAYVLQRHIRPEVRHFSYSF